MSGYIKNGLKILYNYALSLMVFALLVYVFLTVAGDKFGSLLPIYSFIMFLLSFFLIYSDIKKLAIKEKKPQYDLHPYPLKGLYYGIIGTVPIALLEILSVFLDFGSEFGNRFKHLALNTMMGPFYFIIKLFGEKPAGYILATLTIPVMAALGYLAGYYGFELLKRLRKQKDIPKARTFEKSPWNPSNKAGSASGKKKKTKQAKSI